MEHYDGQHWHWWHWLIIIAVVFIVMGIAYTFIGNISNNRHQSYVRGVEETIEHPIDKTENVVKDIGK